MSTKSVWVAFLMTPSSIPRMLNAVLERGISVEPWVSDKKMTIHREGAPSTVLSVRLTHEGLERKEVFSFLSKIMTDLDVPYYGMSLSDSAPHINSGRLPEITKQRTVPQGPYRTVIPFPPPKKED